MAKKRITIIALIFIIALHSVFAAVATATTEIKSDSFVLEFKKPPYNRFFFSDPANPANEANIAKGIPFSYADLTQGNIGYPSTAMFAITYRFESNGTFKVYANANLDHSNIYRLYAYDANAGLNYKIEIFTDKAKADAGTPVETTIDTTVSSKDAIYIDTITAPMTQDVSKVFKLTLKSKEIGPESYEPYIEGQYTGYLVLEFIPSI